MVHVLDNALRVGSIWAVGPTMKNRSATIGTSLLLSVLLALMAALAWQLIDNLHLHQRLVLDRAELRHVKYGMLNADKWVHQTSEIVEKKVRELEVRGEARESMKQALERILDTLITETDRYIREQHTTGNWWDRTTGKIKEGVRGAVMDVETIKAGIPQYAEQILVELENPDTRREIGDFLTAIVGDLASSTFGKIDETPREEIFDRHGCGDTTECKAKISRQLDDLDRQSAYLAAGLLLGAAVMLLAAYRTASPDYRLPWALVSFSTMLLLACGVLTPMLEVEAQISELRFVLMGYPVEFFNEVIYFQSKSILDVVSILTETRKVDMVLVGVLLVTFSVIFPTLKLLASLLYVYNPKGSRQSVAVRFFALKSGKWSMADVMVIAILMAYIAFDGMVSSQLNLISRGAATAGVEVLTTNGTRLQPGFFMFLAFCVFSLFVSTLMQASITNEAEYASDPKP